MPEHDLASVKRDISDSAPADSETKDRYDDETRSLEFARFREEYKSLKQDREERKTYGDRLFRLIVAWLGVAAIILILAGFKICQFELPTTVLATLIGGATASVIGLFAIVATYLFPKP